jgi:hypothetical protein
MASQRPFRRRFPLGEQADDLDAHLPPVEKPGGSHREIRLNPTN